MNKSKPKKSPNRTVEEVVVRKLHQKAIKRKAWSKLRIVLATLVAACFAALFLTPIILTISNSFMSGQEISANYGSVFATTATGGKVYISSKVNLKFIPDMVSFSQYSTVLIKSPEYLLKFWNSVILVAPIVIFQLVVACLASYGFARGRGRVREMVFFGYIILMLMPYQVTLVPNYLIATWTNLLDTRWAIWLPGIFSPFAVFLITKFIRRVPTEIIEAAQIDGAGEWQIFKKVCMPLCKGVICSAAILVFIDYWNMVEQPLILLADDEMHPLSVFLSKINASEIGLAFAVATIYMVPSLLVFLYGEEFLVEGITYQGGIKG
jgi:multiple sugar transport system permease protein